MNQERIETATQHGSSLLVVSVTDSRHQKRGTEATADLVIDTTGLSPRGLNNSKCNEINEKQIYIK